MFTNRVEAGKLLADQLTYLKASLDTVVLGLPRGGVVVAHEIAKALELPLDVIVVRKLGVPGQPELAMGAVGEEDALVVNRDVLRAIHVPDAEFDDVEARERHEVEKRANLYRSARSRAPLKGKTVIIVDDGIATGSTARAACQVARAHGAGKIILAVPVAPQGWEERFENDADEMLSLMSPRDFMAVGEWYQDFRQVTDDEVVHLLNPAAT